MRPLQLGENKCFKKIIYASYGTLQYRYFQTGNPNRHYVAQFTDKNYLRTVAYGCNQQKNTVKCYEATVICPVCHVKKLCRMFEHWIFCVRGRARNFLNSLLLHYYLLTFFLVILEFCAPRNFASAATPLVASPTLRLCSNGLSKTD